MSEKWSLCQIWRQQTEKWGNAISQAAQLFLHTDVSSLQVSQLGRNIFIGIICLFVWSRFQVRSPQNRMTADRKIRKSHFSCNPTLSLYRRFFVAGITIGQSLFEFAFGIFSREKSLQNESKFCLFYLQDLWLWWTRNMTGKPWNRVLVNNFW